MTAADLNAIIDAAGTHVVLPIDEARALARIVQEAVAFYNDSEFGSLLPVKLCDLMRDAGLIP